MIYCTLEDFLKVCEVVDHTGLTLFPCMKKLIEKEDIYTINKMQNKSFVQCPKFFNKAQ